MFSLKGLASNEDNFRSKTKFMSPHPNHPNQIKNDLETWVKVTKLLSFSVQFHVVSMLT